MWSETQPEPGHLPRLPGAALLWRTGRSLVLVLHHSGATLRRPVVCHGVDWGFPQLQQMHANGGR